MKCTVFFDQINRTNFQVRARNEERAISKAHKLYKKHFDMPSCSVQQGWIVETDGEDK